MQRRTIWIIGGSVVGVLLVLCLLVGGIAWFMTRQVQRQEQELSNILATITANVEAVGVTATAELDAAGPRATSGPAVEPTVGATAQATGPTDLATIPAEATTSATVTPGGADNANVSAALVPQSQLALAEQGNATLYQIEAVLDPEQHTVAGEQSVRLTNTEDVALDELYFRLYVNAPHYNEGGIIVTAVTVDGVTATPALEADETTLRIRLPRQLQPGATTEVAMRFTTTVPQSGGGYGIFNEDEGVFALYN